MKRQENRKKIKNENKNYRERGRLRVGSKEGKEGKKKKMGGNEKKLE